MVNRNKTKSAGDYYPGYRHPKILIGYVVYSSPHVESRDVSEQLMMRGIAVSYETIREWSLTFMPMK